MGARSRLYFSTLTDNLLHRSVSESLPVALQRRWPPAIIPGKLTVPPQILSRKPGKYQRKGAKSISIRMWNISQNLKRTFSLCLWRRDLRMDSRQALRACALGVAVRWAMAVGNRLGASLFGVLLPTVCAATIQIAHGRRTPNRSLVIDTLCRHSSGFLGQGSRSCRRI